MKKANPILVLCLALTQFCHAQAYKKEKLTFYDANGEETEEKNSVVLEQVINFDDTLYEINFYQTYGPMIRSVQSKYPDGSLRTGNYRCYDAVGDLDTSGTYQAGKREGEWSVYSNGKYTQQLMYENGILVWTKDTVELKRESDSIAAGAKRDTSIFNKFPTIPIEAAFPGGAQAWLRYINKNLRYPDRAVNKNLMGKVVIAFIVDKEGNLPSNKVYVAHSLEYSLDQEALRIILSSSAWTPAVQNGKAVNSYKKQPLSSGWKYTKTNGFQRSRIQNFLSEYFETSENSVSLRHATGRSKSEVYSGLGETRVQLGY